MAGGPGPSLWNGSSSPMSHECKLNCRYSCEILQVCPSINHNHNHNILTVQLFELQTSGNQVCLCGIYCRWASQSTVWRWWTTFAHMGTMEVDRDPPPWQFHTSEVGHWIAYTKYLVITTSRRVCLEWQSSGPMLFASAAPWIDQGFQLVWPADHVHLGSAMHGSDLTLACIPVTEWWTPQTTWSG